MKDKFKKCKNCPASSYGGPCIDVLLEREKMKKILFKPEMVRAILAGRKTQTRRIHSDMSKPRYNVGEIVYVGEAYFKYGHDIEYKEAMNACGHEEPSGYLTTHKLRWKSGMFMSEENSRINLKITEVKKHKLGDMTAEEARAEGFGIRCPSLPVAEFWDYFEKIAPNITEDTEVWAYTFEVVK